MNDLKQDARALFDVARSAHEPTSREHERVLSGVLARGAMVAGMTSANVGAAAAKGLLATNRVVSTLKILAGFAILGGTGAGLYRVSTAQTAQTALAVVHAPLPTPTTQDNGQHLEGTPENRPAVGSVHATKHGPDALEAPKVRRPSSPAANVGGQESPAASPPADPALAATQGFPASAPPDGARIEPASAPTLSREARALADVQRELREGRSAEALVMLAGQNREFAGGALGQEREAARVMALCAAGRVAEGRLAAERFLTANPGSPVATHIRSSCGVP